MAAIDFDTTAATITKHTVDNDKIRIAIDMQIQKLVIEVTVTTHYSDASTTLQQKNLVLRDDDFTPAMAALFPTDAWSNPRVDFKASIITLLKANKDKLI